MLLCAYGAKERIGNRAKIPDGTAAVSAEAALVDESRSLGNQSALLVPALGWGVTYRYDFHPDEGWCSFFGPLCVFEETEALIGFKEDGYNLSR